MGDHITVPIGIDQGETLAKGGKIVVESVGGDTVVIDSTLDPDYKHDV